MRHHHDIAALLQRAQAEQRCAFGTDRAQRQALSRRADARELTKISANLYADTAYWNALSPPERALHMARAFHIRHPHWQFGGLTAAAAHGFEHRWGLHGDAVTITTATRGTNADNPAVKRIYTPPLSSVVTNGIPVTDAGRTVVDCGITLGFRSALPVFDSALAQGLSRDDILTQCGRIGRRSRARVRNLLRYADPRSENGGESLARGTIIEQRFMIPDIQVDYVDPLTGERYRPDFVWRLPDGRIVIGEFDGTEKYVNPAMTDRQAIRDVVATERRREAALTRAGVTTIIRFTYDEVVQVQPLVHKLLTAGIPRYQRDAAGGNDSLTNP